MNAKDYYDSLRVAGKLGRNGKPFADGAWQAEPDRIEWQAHGFTCLASRNRMGAWCGYVAVPPGHPWHGKHYDAVPAEVHGGLTYAEACNGLICHEPAPGESDDVWWLGFDCAHSGDHIPAMDEYRYRFLGGPSDTYRDANYIRAETERLAEQARAVQP